MDITENEVSVILNILKSPEKEFNANNLSKIIGISSMGVLKILKRLHEEDILIVKKIGNISIYKINFNEYACDYINFLLKREAEHSEPYIRRWINELKKIHEAEIIIIFGSILKKLKKAKDVDVMFVVKDINFNKLKRKIEKLNELNDKKIHAVYQNMGDLKENLNKEDRIVLNAIKGIIVYGEKKFVESMELVGR